MGGSALIITCKLGFERVVASYVEELDPAAEVEATPQGFAGLVLVRPGNLKAEELARAVKERVPEAEKVFVADAECNASIEEIVRCAVGISAGISREESFAVRTVRRGSHGFTSLDVNVAVGSAVKEATGARVDLENPDKVIFVQILQDKAYLSLVPGSEFYKKMPSSKYPVYKVFRKLVVAHEPYLGPPDASYVMGTRIGREVQVFEVGKLYVTPVGAVDAYSLYSFLRGAFEGQRSRFELQKRSYGREVVKTEVYVQDMYQFARSRLGKPLIIFEPEGEPVSRVAGEVADFIIRKVFKEKEEVAIMVGAREGVPTGLFRFADFVLDVAPGVVISTEYALSSGLIALATILHEKLVEAASSGELGAGEP
ncbi:SPOUT family RNA methylase [Thermofilum pendens]|uniref:THUMP domain protein n=1 Tax=Thermofilum pendens (strain DSM 2475 / Hrk 5) TaxID=368408 RepID=A1S137_THEPD|nr:SPOUT family RNA methylase [Thermofilum pendens]ABL79167.1 THUMP domain protein [Thermofilum pendens Hrk 5]